MRYYLAFAVFFCCLVNAETHEVQSQSSSTLSDIPFIDSAIARLTSKDFSVREKAVLELSRKYDRKLVIDKIREFAKQNDDPESKRITAAVLRERLREIPLHETIDSVAETLSTEASGNRLSSILDLIHAEFTPEMTEKFKQHQTALQKIRDERSAKLKPGNLDSVEIVALTKAMRTEADRIGFLYEKAIRKMEDTTIKVDSADYRDGPRFEVKFGKETFTIDVNSFEATVSAAWDSKDKDKEFKLSLPSPDQYSTYGRMLDANAFVKGRLSYLEVSNGPLTKNYSRKFSSLFNSRYSADSKIFATYATYALSNYTDPQSFEKDAKIVRVKPTQTTPPIGPAK